MTFRTFKFAAPLIAAAIIVGVASAPANAAPMQKSAVDAGHAHVTLVDGRDGRWRGDRGRDRHWRGDRGRDRREWRGAYARPYYRPYYPPRYAYAPPAYYAPYGSYDYYDYPYDRGYFSYSSPNLGLSFGY